jgi:arylsulfatase A-like enzyme
LEQLIPNEFPSDTTVFGYDFDSAPGIWIKGNPAQTDPVVRQLEHDMAKLQAFDPIVNANVQVMRALADHAEQKLLHMITFDPNRTPNFVLFSNPDFFFTDSGAPNCPAGAALSSCSLQSRNFAWNHGDFQSDITHTWLGIVGPGVRHLGRTSDLFTDHTDIRPTIISLAHLKDDYAHDGRVVFEILDEHVLPDSLRDHRETLSRLAAAYKAINAPNGPLGHKTLVGISTRALKGDDATYAALEDKIEDLTDRRNKIAGRMIAMLEAAAFQRRAIDNDEAEHLINEARELLQSLD